MTVKEPARGKLKAPLKALCHCLQSLRLTTACNPFTPREHAAAWQAQCHGTALHKFTYETTNRLEIKGACRLFNDVYPNPGATDGTRSL